LSPLRFCFPTTFYPPYSFGGDAVGVQRLARALVKRGHEVTVVYNKDAYRLLTKGKEPRGVAANDGVHVVGLESDVGWFAPLLTQQTGHPMANARRLRSILDDGRFDVINFHNTSLIGGPGIFSYGRDATKLYMAHEHWLVCPTHVLWRHNRELCDERQCLRCQLVYRRPPQWWRWTGLMSRELEHLDGFIAMSEFSRAKHHEFGFTRPMEVLPYFLPDPSPSDAFTETPRPHERPYFLFVGRLEAIKGLDDVIPLFARYPGADLLIAGDGNHQPALEELAAGSSQIVFLGRVPLEKLREYYSHAIATLVPSICFETFGIVIIESFRQRTPVIAREIGPFPEIVSACAGGELFDSAETLLSSMARIQGDAEYRDKLADNAYRGYVSNWSEQAVMPRYLELIDRARRT